MTRNDIIESIERYAEASGLKPSTICQYALKNRKVYKTLKSGGNCHFDTADNLAAWMAENPPKKEASAA